MTEGNGEVKELPKGWTTCELQSLCELITKGSTPTTYGHQYRTQGINFVKTENISNNGFIFNIKQFIDKEANAFLKRSQLDIGDVLFSIAGTIGRVGIVRKKDFPANTNQALSIIRLIKNAVSDKYLFYFLKSPLVQKTILKSITGVGRANLSLKDVGELNILLAPFPEQNRIVEKIEELFSDLDQGIESLRIAQKQLKVYRQAVLKWAFEGKLTEEWRKQHSSTLKTGEALLAQIKAERYSNYQGKYSDPVVPKDNPFQELPESWCLVTLDQVSLLVTSGSRGWARYYSDAGSYFIRAQDINTNELNLRNIAYVSLPEGAEGERTRIQTGDILITITGANVTKTALVKINFKKEAYVNQHIGLVRLVESISRKFIYWWLISSEHGHAQLMVAAYGAGKPGLNLTNLKEVLITLPSLKEQEQILQEIESRLSICDRLEDTIIENLQKAEALRQSILKQAFEGKLVPQDPNDEPAEKLLERIKAEREANQASKTLKQLKIKGL
jgi:type I restriction enzyme S subunit